MALLPRSLIPAGRVWKDSSLPKNLVSYSKYFICFRNFATKIQIIFDIRTVLIVYFCNYHTILYIFNSVLCVEIADLYNLLSKVVAR